MVETEEEDKEEGEENEVEEIDYGVPEISKDEKESVVKANTKKITISNKSSPLPKRAPKKSSSKRFKADNDTSPKLFSKKKKNEKATKEKSSTLSKSHSKEKSGDKVSKGKEKAKEEKLKRGDDELRDAICEILKGVDFNMASIMSKHLAKSERPRESIISSPAEGKALHVEKALKRKQENEKLYKVKKACSILHNEAKEEASSSVFQ